MLPLINFSTGQSSPTKAYSLGPGTADACRRPQTLTAAPRGYENLLRMSKSDSLESVLAQSKIEFPDSSQPGFRVTKIKIDNKVFTLSQRFPAITTLLSYSDYHFGLKVNGKNEAIDETNIKLLFHLIQHHAKPVTDKRLQLLQWLDDDILIRRFYEEAAMDSLVDVSLSDRTITFKSLTPRARVNQRDLKCDADLNILTAGKKYHNVNTRELLRLNEKFYRTLAELHPEFADDLTAKADFIKRLIAEKQANIKINLNY